MRKALLVSALALGLAGCAASKTSPPEVRDLSASRNPQGGNTVTVQSGDTLYGIAWRQNMDFRQLAQLNDISPPYRLQPGQTLRLSQGTSLAANTSNASNPNQDGMTAGASGAAAVTGTQNPDWLAPDTEAIERNRQLRSRSLDASQPSGETVAASGQAEGPQAPGPANGDTDAASAAPGADGQPSARAEREAPASQRPSDSQTASTGEPTGASRTGAATAQAGQTGAAAAGAAGAGAATSGGAAADDTSSSSSARDTGGGTRADAGTAVAGEADAPKPQQRTYTPVKDIPWQWPADGQVVGRFGDGSDITAGIDIAGQKGQPVKAAGPGIVVYAGDGVRGYGNLILLKHNDSYLSAYAHNDSLRVKENDVVEAGEVIAAMGNTDAESVKLHFEVRQDGQPQDPLEFLPQR